MDFACKDIKIANREKGSTPRIVEELGLEVGSDAYAVIKATNVMVGIDE